MEGSPRPAPVVRLSGGYHREEMRSCSLDRGEDAPAVPCSPCVREGLIAGGRGGTRGTRTRTTDLSDREPARTLSGRADARRRASRSAAATWRPIAAGARAREMPRTSGQPARRVMASAASAGDRAPAASSSPARRLTAPPTRTARRLRYVRPAHPAPRARRAASAAGALVGRGAAFRCRGRRTRASLAALYPARRRRSVIAGDGRGSCSSSPAPPTPAEARASPGRRSGRRALRFERGRQTAPCNERTGGTRPSCSPADVALDPGASNAGSSRADALGVRSPPRSAPARACGAPRPACALSDTAGRPIPHTGRARVFGPVGLAFGCGSTGRGGGQPAGGRSIMSRTECCDRKLYARRETGLSGAS